MAEIIDEFLSSNASSKAVEVCPEMLDYSFVQGCNDVDELRAILASLQSGQHGRYPHLEETVQSKLTSLLPEKERKKIAAMKLQLSVEEANLAKTDLMNWFGGLSTIERSTQSNGLVNASSCPVRSSVKNLVAEQIQQPNGKPAVEKNLIRKEKLSKEDDESEYEAKMKAPELKVAGNETEAARSCRENDMYELRLRLNELQEAERQFSSVREREKGNEYFKSGDNYEALHCYSKSVMLDPSNSKSFANRASVLVRLERHEEAIKDCTKAFELEPTYTRAIARRAMIFHQLGRYQEAAADFRVCNCLDPNAGYSRLQAKSEEKLQQELDKNLSEQTMTRLTIEEVEEVDDDDIEEVYTPGIQEMENASTQSIKADSDKTSKDKAKVEQSSWQKISIVEVSDSDEENINNDSESFLMRRVEIVEEESSDEDQSGNSGMVEPQFNRDESNRYKEEGNKAMKANLLVKAIKLYSKALDLDPTNSSAYNNRAMVHIKTAEFDKAIADSTSCLALEPQNTKALYRRGLAQMMSSKDTETIRSAQSDFEAALSFSPSEVILSKKLKECRKLLQDSSPICPKDQNAIDDELSNSLATDKTKAKKRSHDTSALCF